MGRKKEFTFYWLTGHKEKLKGETPAEALTLGGYSNGAVRALDFYSEKDDPNYVFENGKWINKQILTSKQ